MNPSVAPATLTESLSHSARCRMLSVKGEPLFYADWLRAVFIHYEVDAEVLQPVVPFQLELYQDKAYISLVAFTMRNMRPRIGGSLAALLFKPIASHGFLNVRTYVKHQDEPGIYFLAEWLSNPLSLRLGPPLFGLPYRLGHLLYQHDHEIGELRGLVTARNNTARLEYISQVDTANEFRPCDAGTREEFLMERYTAFTANRWAHKLFRIWHPPWPQISIHVQVMDSSLLTDPWPWFKEARLVGANYSPGFQRVWMGRPQRIWATN